MTNTTFLLHVDSSLHLRHTPLTLSQTLYGSSTVFVCFCNAMCFYTQNSSSRIGC